MATYVLVHGAWHGSWCWKRVRSLLRAEGHEVFTPTLTGLGERSHLLSQDIHLQTHIDDVVNLIRWEELRDIVLCGHSYAGIVITGVAERLPELIRRLVYLDAVVVEPGGSVFSMFSQENVEAQYAQADKEGEGWKLPPPPARSGLVAGQDAAWVDRQCTPHPIQTLEEPLNYTDRATCIADTRFIMSTNWPKSSDGRLQSPWISSMELARQRGWSIEETATHHDVMLDDPMRLAELLMRGA